jgi:ketosteroid isomerase-like protein
MKRIVLAAAFAALLVAPAASPPPTHAQTPAPLDTLVAAERAFAAMSSQSGMKQAFLANLAPDAIVFDPGPVAAVPVWEARQPSKYRLLWEPSWAEVSGNGDLGVTTGPWVVEPGDRDTVIAQGHFMTVWKRRPGTPWVVAVDLGIDHDPLARGGYGDVTLEPGVEHSPFVIGPGWRGGSSGMAVGLSSGAFGFGIGTVMSPQEERDRIMAHELNAMMNTDRGYLYDRRGKGVAEALSRVAAPDVHVYRGERMPARGPMEAIELLKPLPPATELLPFGARVASSYDLGYSYGLLLSRQQGASRADTSGYVHVFRRDESGKWKLIFDVETAYPKRK